MDVRTQTFHPWRPFGQWPQGAEWAAALLRGVSALAMAPARALDWVDNRLAEIDRNADEAYLAEAHDLYDLETRMRRLDRRRDPASTV